MPERAEADLALVQVEPVNLVPARAAREREQPGPPLLPESVMWVEREPVPPGLPLLPESVMWAEQALPVLAGPLQASVPVPAGSGSAHLGLEPCLLATTPPCPSDIPQ